MPSVLGLLPPSCKTILRTFFGKFIGKNLDPEEGVVWQKTIFFVHPLLRQNDIQLHCARQMKFQMKMGAVRALL